MDILHWKIALLTTITQVNSGHVNGHHRMPRMSIAAWSGSGLWPHCVRLRWCKSMGV